MNFSFKNLNRDSFTYWMFVHLMGSYSGDKDIWESLRETTNNWENINITMQINGEEVDAGVFIDLVQRSMDHRAKTEAKALISEALPDLDDLQNTLNSLSTAIENKVRNWATEHDIDFDPYDY